MRHLQIRSGGDLAGGNYLVIIDRYKRIGCGNRVQIPVFRLVVGNQLDKRGPSTGKGPRTGIAFEIPAIDYAGITAERYIYLPVQRGIAYRLGKRCGAQTPDTAINMTCATDPAYRSRGVDYSVSCR